MMITSRWIQRRRKEYQLTKEVEARETERRLQQEKLGHQQTLLAREAEARETERRLQQEKLDHQRTERLLGTLRVLQHTMDPLIALQVYNNRFCRLIGRLPEELLLGILEFLYDDVVTVLCLRMVSRIFFRLLNYKSSAWRNPFQRGPWRPSIHYLPRGQLLQFRRLLQRSGRCDNCRRWNDAHAHVLYDDCKFHQRRREPPLFGRLYCYACHSLHDFRQFSSTYQLAWRDQPERRCLGQQGLVKLCEHVQIAWASIKEHIDKWRREQECGGGDWQACLDSFTIECHDISHDTRCTPLGAPTWPRARLSKGTHDSDFVVLNLEWAPHARIDALALPGDKRIPATELRALFQRLRLRGPADTLYPSYRPGALPEMACCGSSSYIGTFIEYEAGEGNETVLQPPLVLPPYWQIWPYLFDRYGLGRCGKILRITPHCLEGDGDNCSALPQCLEVSYKKDIMICKIAHVTDPAIKIIPTDHWLHAMDINTYPYPLASHIRPECKDSTCPNYYQKPREAHSCNTWPRADRPLNW